MLHGLSFASSRTRDGTKVALTGTLLYTAHCAIYDARRTEKDFLSQPEEGQATQQMKPKRTILCADSNEQALSIRKILLETRGYRVLTCTRGEDALARFAQGGVDLVLADLALNGLDGARLVQETKKASPATPAILLSSKARILDAGTPADAFFSKGAQTPAELLERVRQLLVRKRGPKRPADAPSQRVGVGVA
jgi:CheY-like chemotaxis protein